MLSMAVALVVITCIGATAHFRLAMRRSDLFTDYLNKTEISSKKRIGQDWILTGRQVVDIPPKVDYNASWKRFHKTRFWDYEFSKMIVFKKEK